MNDPSKTSIHDLDEVAEFIIEHPYYYDHDLLAWFPGLTEDELLWAHEKAQKLLDRRARPWLYPEIIEDKAPEPPKGGSHPVPGKKRRSHRDRRCLRAFIINQKTRLLTLYAQSQPAPRPLPLGRWLSEMSRMPKTHKKDFQRESRRPRRIDPRAVRQLQLYPDY